MSSAPPPGLEHLPAQESLGLSGANDELEQFDHLAAYRRLGPTYQLRFRGERRGAIGGMGAGHSRGRAGNAAV
jgi:hypothetical protein